MNLSFKSPLARFLLTALFLYVAWYVLYELWLHPIRVIDEPVIKNLSWASSLLLSLLGYDLIPDPMMSTIETVGVDGTSGVWIGDPCNGIALFALFTGFIIAFPGPLKKKLWFIPLGLFTIHLINIMRITALALIIYYFPDPEILDFNHNYTFTITVYGYVFFLWYIWAEKISGGFAALKDKMKK